MSELKKSDPKLYDALKAKKDKKKAERKASLAKLMEFCLANGTDEIKVIARSLVTRAPADRSGVTKTNVLVELFKDGQVVTEMKVFERFRLGRAEMRKIIINAIKKAKPEERMWVSFDAEKGVYKLEAKGANPPANWTGYRPLIVDGKEVK